GLEAALKYFLLGALAAAFFLYGTALHYGATGSLLAGTPGPCKRWVVERTFAWLGRNRRLAKDYEANPRVSEAWVYLGMLRLLVKRLARAA
ncbi:hypothetical protein CSW36_07550, partial [Thermus scotoductus]